MNPPENPLKTKTVFHPEASGPMLGGYIFARSTGLQRVKGLPKRERIPAKPPASAHRSPTASSSRAWPQQCEGVSQMKPERLPNFARLRVPKTTKGFSENQSASVSRSLARGLDLCALWLELSRFPPLAVFGKPSGPGQKGTSVFGAWLG